MPVIPILTKAEKWRIVGQPGLHKDLRPIWNKDKELSQRKNGRKGNKDRREEKREGEGGRGREREREIERDIGREGEREIGREGEREGKKKLTLSSPDGGSCL